jgi:transcriptional regulator with XRE-family HTH domain
MRDRKPRALTFGQRVKLARELAGMSQEDVAKGCQCTKAMISAIETGLIKPPRANNVLKVSRLLGVPIEVEEN